MSLRVLAAALILAVLGGLVSACSHRSSTPPPSFSRPSGLIGRWDFDTVTKASTRAIGVMGRPFIYFTGVGTVRGDEVGGFKSKASGSSVSPRRLGWRCSTCKQPPEPSETATSLV